MSLQIRKLEPKSRFSSRVADYEAYRPSYPNALLDEIESHMSLKGLPVADVGCGTGIFSKLLLERGAIVFGVEPNSKMRESSSRQFSHDLNFRAVAGSAERTELSASSVSLITCAQSFHWFEPSETRQEFNRILKPDGLIALIWNDPKTDNEVGLRYDEIKVSYCGKSLEAITEVTKNLDNIIPSFFERNGYQTKIFDNFQNLDLTGLIGRFFSSSYAPTPDSDLYAQAKQALTEMFRDLQQEGFVRLEYRTELILGR